MDKTKNKYEEHKKKKWIDIPVTFKKRTCGTGVTFGGKYVENN